MKFELENPDAILAWQKPLGRRREEHGEHVVGDQSRRIAAELRRVRRPEDAAFHEGYHQLRRLIKNGSDAAVEVLAILAPNIAHTPGAHLPRVLGKGEEGPVMSPLRFRRIVETVERRALHRPLMRAIRLVGGKIDYLHLAESLLMWGDAMRRGWAREYYTQLPTTETKVKK